MTQFEAREKRLSRCVVLELKQTVLPVTAVSCGVTLAVPPRLNAFLPTAAVRQTAFAYRKRNDKHLIRLLPIKAPQIRRFAAPSIFSKVWIVSCALSVKPNEVRRRARTNGHPMSFLTMTAYCRTRIPKIQMIHFEAGERSLSGDVIVETLLSVYAVLTSPVVPLAVLPKLKAFRPTAALIQTDFAYQERTRRMISRLLRIEAPRMNQFAAPSAPTTVVKEWIASCPLGVKPNEVHRRATEATRHRQGLLDQENRNPEASGGLYSVCDSIDDGDDARERVDCSVLYPIGTRVRKYYDCYGWVSGEIAQFEGVYRVRYEDGDEEDFLADDKELEEIVLQAQSKRQPTSCSPASILPMGTPVDKHFPGYGWFAGQIVAFDGLYLVRHDDGDEEELFYDSPEVARIVANATNNP
jgi:hypothetical protein